MCTCTKEQICELCHAEEVRSRDEGEAELRDMVYAHDVISVLQQLRWSCDNDLARQAVEHAMHCVAMIHNLPVR